MRSRDSVALQEEKMCSHRTSVPWMYSGGTRVLLRVQVISWTIQNDCHQRGPNPHLHRTSPSELCAHQHHHPKPSLSSPSNEQPVQIDQLNSLLQVAHPVFVFGRLALLRSASATRGILVRPLTRKGSTNDDDDNAPTSHLRRRTDQSNRCLPSTRARPS